MSLVPTHVLYEHAVGYTLFNVKEFEDIGSIIPEVRKKMGKGEGACCRNSRILIFLKQR